MRERLIGWNICIDAFDLLLLEEPNLHRINDGHFRRRLSNFTATFAHLGRMSYQHPSIRPKTLFEHVARASKSPVLLH